MEFIMQIGFLIAFAWGFLVLALMYIVVPIVSVIVISKAVGYIFTSRKKENAKCKVARTNGIKLEKNEDVQDGLKDL